jgi:hypothetical protein
MTYTIKCRLDDDAFAMMRKAREFCANDESATAFCTDIINDTIEVWTVETAANIDEHLEQNPDVLEYERPPLNPAPQKGYGRG